MNCYLINIIQCHLSSTKKCYYITSNIYTLKTKSKVFNFSLHFIKIIHELDNEVNLCEVIKTEKCTSPGKNTIKN